MESRRLLSLLCAAALATIALPPPASAQTKSTGPKSSPDTPATSPSSPPRNRLQPQGRVYLYEQAPDFELETSNGRRVKLSSQRGDWVVLIFAPYRERFQGFQPHVEELARRGVRLVGVCGDKQHQLISMAQREGVSFLMMADVTRDVAALYGLLDPVTRKIVPGVFLLDPRGTVQLMVLGQVPEPEDLVALAMSPMPAVVP